MSLPIATLTGANTIAQLIYNVNQIKTLAANTDSLATKVNKSGDTMTGQLIVDSGDTSTLALLRGDTYGTRFGFDGSASYIDAVTADVSDYAPLVFNAKTSMTFNMNSSEKMRIDSSGTFSVGTTGGLVSELIHARRSSGTISTLYNNGSTGDVLRLYHENTAVTAFSIWGVGAQRGFITSPVSSNGLIFGTSSTERMRLAANGNFGIGTSSPNDYGAGFVNLQINSTTGGIIQATYGGTTAIAEILTTSGEGRFGTRTNHPMILKTNNTERMRITAAGKVGIGTSNPLSALHVNGSVSLNQYYEAYLVNAYYDGAWKYLGNGVAWGIGNNFNGAANSLTLATAAVNAGGAAAALTWVPALSISVAGASTFSGDVGVRGAPGTTFGTNTWGPELQAVGGQGIASLRASGDAFGGALNLAGARGTFASPSIVLNNDALGAVYFDGFDGGDYLSYGASIVAYVDGTPGVNDMPTRLVFSTSADGSNTPTERMRITSAGLVGIGAAPTTSAGLETYQTNSSTNVFHRGDNHGLRFGFSAGESLIDSVTAAISDFAPLQINAKTSLTLRLNSATVVALETSGMTVTGTARATQGTPYTTYTANTKTLALTDNGYYTRCSNTTLITITIPNNSTVAFPLGSEIVFFQAGSGNVLFANAAGVTLNSKESNKNLTGQYSAATLKKIATNTWDLIGDLA
jgi:hypothetical protein